MNKKVVVYKNDDDEKDWMMMTKRWIYIILKCMSWCEMMVKKTKPKLPLKSIIMEFNLMIYDDEAQEEEKREKIGPIKNKV